jgi:hypothetical protein
MTDHRIRGQLKKFGRQTRNCLRSAAWQTCKCAMWIVCSPCICCAVLFISHPGVQRRHTGRVVEKPMVPSPRRRALTIPSTDWQEDQSTLDQPQSAFMTKLPLEIRRLIYEKALGEASIQLGVCNGKLTARRRSVSALDDRPFTMEQITLILPLLRTCRKM